MPPSYQIYYADPKDNIFQITCQTKLDRLLGVSKLISDVNAANTRAQWLLPPEVLDPGQFGPIDHRIDIYHLGLLFLQIAHSKRLQFTREEILSGKPRIMALQLPPPYNAALEKALRRRVNHRTASAVDLWRDFKGLTNI